MKLKYLALVGLFVITLGCFLPFRVGLAEGNRPLSFLSVSGILFVLISKEGPFGNGRVLGGIFGSMLGLIIVFFIVDSMGIPYASGIHLVFEGPFTLLVGSALACFGGFSDFSGSRNFHLGTILSILGIGSIATFFF